MTSALPLLYQSGYLTIKGYDFYSQTYILDYPNAEVKTGFLDCFLQTVLNIKGYDSQGFAGMLYASLIYHDIEKFMATMKAFLLPYLTMTMAMQFWKNLRLTKPIMKCFLTLSFP